MNVLIFLMLLIITYPENIHSQEVEGIVKGVSCHVCHYYVLSSSWFGKKRSTLSILDEKLRERCGDNYSNIQECSAGVKTCALSVTEEKIRYNPTRENPVNKHNDGFIVVSHFCGHREDTETKCAKYESTSTGGIQVSCLCRGSGCNYGINVAAMATVTFVHILFLVVLAGCLV